MHRLNLYGPKVSQERNKQEAGAKHISIELYGLITQKIVLFSRHIILPKNNFEIEQSVRN
jgi:hypothetical protein